MAPGTDWRFERDRAAEWAPRALPARAPLPARARPAGRAPARGHWPRGVRAAGRARPRWPRAWRATPVARCGTEWSLAGSFLFGGRRGHHSARAREGVAVEGRVAGRDRLGRDRLDEDRLRAATGRLGLVRGDRH